MKTNELRIGNFVGFKNRKDLLYCEVQSIDSYGGIDIIRYFFEGYVDSQPEIIENITFIELTEEWLIKFGFNDIEDKLYCKRWRLDRVDIYKMISGNYPFYFRFNQVDSKIKYVHQLQNLYFSLTGKELKIKKS